VTKPFLFEGKKRMKHAEQGMAWLRENVDSLITIPNQRLLAISGATLSMVDAFKKADEVLLNAVQGISDLINHTGLINSDFADVRTIMQNKGLALMGIGYAEGEHRAVEAATNAISSPLLEDISIDGATGIIINITGGSNLKIHEVNEATTLIMEAAHEDAEIIFGTVIDESLKDQVKVTVIATGLGGLAPLQKVDSALQSQAPARETITLSAEPVTAPIGFAQPPQPNAEMLAQVQPQPQMQAELVSEAVAPVVSPVAARSVESDKEPELRSEEEVAPQAMQPGLAQMASRPMGTGAEGGELARARAIAQRLGITNLTDDEYDIPTYMRRQPDQEM
jgi:cell division protein FtsZ